VVIGGDHEAAERDEPGVIEAEKLWLRRRARHARRIASFPAGTHLLAAAGMLDGAKVTTHWSSLHRLEPFATVDARADVTQLRDRHIWTCAGATAPIDGGSLAAAHPCGGPHGFAFAAPLAAWAVGVTRPNRIQALYRFVLLPLYMFSGTFFSPDQLPGWLHHIVVVTPLYQGIALCRGIALGGSGLRGYALYLAVLAVLGIAAGLRTYSRHTPATSRPRCWPPPR
jgi:hypothetical protein